MTNSNTDYVDRGFGGDGLLFKQLRLEVISVIVAVLAAFVLAWTASSPQVNIAVMVGAGIIFTLSIVIVLRLVLDPESVRARQSDAMLQLANSTLDYMKDGLTPEAAQNICEVLLPHTAAIAVAITGREYVLGYTGYHDLPNPAGNIIRTQATYDTIADGQMRVLHTSEDIGFPQDITLIKAAIIVPLSIGDKIEGTLKFYYRSPRRITATQRSIAEGFGRLLSTQMAAREVEAQRKLATSMELKMLQSQINPHFLFNTINTIASLIRTDPMKARTLLRDFAIFYRRTLEDSSERIMLSREIEQTMRYFSFEIARFGEERLAMWIATAPDVRDMMVPPFILQPLVENAVRHAMPPEGQLLITINAEVSGDDIIVELSDNGVGMSKEACEGVMAPARSTGMGIAVKNVR
ncbi:MAG: histidine kinase, partial [Eggerthellaceae bacterium]|nr:histidine kinase [Eggerthellaceae bacterium]